MFKNESNFEVVELEIANKKGYIVAKIKFNTSEKVFTYVRKAYDVGNKCNENYFVISGYKVYFDKDALCVIMIEKEYETKGIKKFNTSNSSKTIEKINNEIKSKQISTKEVKKSININKIIKHEQYENIKLCLECNIPVFISGPAGSGKNFTVEQIAKELNWNFYFSNSIQQEYKLTGFIDAGGDYHKTEFYKACTDENDCIFFLDEIDASIPEVLVLLNAAIANGYFEFPTGRVNLDKVHFVSAGNTVGSGADDMYTGRMVIDQATLDRFALIEFDYDTRIELKISNNNNDLIDFVHELRKDAELKGIRATFSYRCIMMMTKLENAGMDIKTAISISVLKGLDKDTISTLNANGESKYIKALNELKSAA